MKKQDYFGRERGRRLKGAKKKKEEIKGFKFKEKSGIYSRILLTRGKKLAAHAAKIMRDVNYGWLIRYAHANGASFFYEVYIPVGSGLY